MTELINADNLDETVSSLTHVDFRIASDKIKFTESTKDDKSKKRKQPMVSVLWPIIQTFGSEWTVGVFMKFIYDVLHFPNPQILG